MSNYYVSNALSTGSANTNVLMLYGASDNSVWNSQTPTIVSAAPPRTETDMDWLKRRVTEVLFEPEPIN